MPRSTIVSTGVLGLSVLAVYLLVTRVVPSAAPADQSATTVADPALEPPVGTMAWRRAGQRERPLAPEVAPDLELATPASSPEPLPPSEENARMLSALRASGPATRDDQDELAYDVVQGVVGELAGLGVTAQLDDYECAAAGCAASFSFASIDDYQRASRQLQGLTVRSPSLIRWRGSRAYPPSIDDVSGVKARMILIRADVAAPVFE